MDLLEQVFGPDDLTGSGRHVVNEGRVVSPLAKSGADFSELFGVVVEDMMILGGEIMFQGVTNKDALKLLKQFKRVLDVSESLEVGVDKVLEIVVEEGDFDVELNEFSVKLVVLVVQQVVSLASELGDQDVESVGNVSDAFEAVLLQSVELLDSGKDVNEFLDSSAE